MEKLKIMHLLNSNSFSGAENVVCTIINNMKSEYDMIYCSPDGPIKNKLEEENICFYPIKKLSFFELKKAIKNIKPDIIHAHDNRATILASLFSKKVKIISHIHGNNVIMNSLNLKTILFNTCSKKIDRFIWVSDSSLEGYYFNKNLIKKSIVLYNVVDKNKIIEKSNEYLIKEDYDLIFLGRLAYPKNPERLIDIMKLLKERKKNISLAIVGDGIDREKIEIMVENYGLKNNVTFYGFQKNPYPILKKSRKLIITSIYEGTPMAALEALCLGIPVIATPVDGLKKIIKNDINGFLSNDDKELVKAILKNNYSNISPYNNIETYINTIKKLYIK